MNALIKNGERITDNIKPGDILEILDGVFVKIKKTNFITEYLAGRKKTSIKLKVEILSNKKSKRRN